MQGLGITWDKKTCPNCDGDRLKHDIINKNAYIKLGGVPNYVVVEKKVCSSCGAVFWVRRDTWQVVDIY